jgi:hypothetical protein
MGLFNRKGEEPAGAGPLAAGRVALAAQAALARQQALAGQAALAAQAALASRCARGGGGAGGGQARAGTPPGRFHDLGTPGHGDPGTASAGLRETLHLRGLRPPKKLLMVTAYVYCDYCTSLIDSTCGWPARGQGAWPGVRRGGEQDHGPGQAAMTAGDRDGYRELQRRVFDAYVANVPMAVSHRTANDPGYRRAYVAFMAEGAVARAFDPASQALQAEMKQRVLGLRYSGNMMSPTVAPESFWPMVETLEQQLDLGRVLYRSAGLGELDPDHAEPLTGKLGWSGFCQGWLACCRPMAARCRTGT